MSSAVLIKAFNSNLLCDVNRSLVKALLPIGTFWAVSSENIILKPPGAVRPWLISEHYTLQASFTTTAALCSTVTLVDEVF